MTTRSRSYSQSNCVAGLGGGRTGPWAKGHPSARARVRHGWRLLAATERGSRVALLVSALASFGVIVADTLAIAECAIPKAILFAPPSGTRLPPEPSIYMFLRQKASYGYGKLGEISVLDGDGKPLPYQRETLPGTDDVMALRMDLAARSGRAVVRVWVLGQEEVSASYRISAHTPVPKRASYTEIVEAGYFFSEGFHGDNGFMLAVRPKAPAYRVEDGRQTWVVPSDDDDDLGGGRRKAVGLGSILTGQISCADFAIPTDKPLALRVTPLFSNGEGTTRKLGCRASKAVGELCGTPAFASFSGRVKGAVPDYVPQLEDAIGSRRQPILKVLK